MATKEAVKHTPGPWHVHEDYPEDVVAEMLEALRDIARIARKDSVPKRTIAERAEALIAKVEGRQ